MDIKTRTSRFTAAQFGPICADGAEEPYAQGAGRGRTRAACRERLRPKSKIRRVGSEGGRGPWV